MDAGQLELARDWSQYIERRCPNRVVLQNSGVFSQPEAPYFQEKMQFRQNSDLPFEKETRTEEMYNRERSPADVHMVTTAVETLDSAQGHELAGERNNLLTDGELLECFIHRRVESAFEVLLRRHGPMVLGVCRRTLRNEADAEDAFQATFLVLVRKAATIRPRSRVANWLYGVARSTALKARAMNKKRSEKEAEAAARPRPEPTMDTWQQIRPVLDRELTALPDKYRTAIIHCDLEGKSLKEAAQELGCPIATIGTRVARGRVLLGRRLARRGITLTSGALAFVLSQNAASAAIPPALVDATTKATSKCLTGSGAADGAVSIKVSALTAAVLKALFYSRLKLALAVLLAVGAVSLAGASLSGQLKAFDRPHPANKNEISSDRLSGTWTLVSLERAGVAVPKDSLKNYGTLTFDSDNFRGETSKLGAGSYRMNADSGAKQIDFAATISNLPNDISPLFQGAGICKLEGNTLTVCLPGPDSNPNVRPTEFVSKGGSQWTIVIVLQRVPLEHTCGC